METTSSERAPLAALFACPAQSVENHTELCAALRGAPLSLAVTAVATSDEAIARLADGVRYAVVLAVHQPGTFDGFAVLGRAGLLAPDSLRVLLGDAGAVVPFEAPVAGTAPIIRVPSADARNVAALVCEGLKLVRLVAEQRELVSRLGLEYDKLQRREKLLDVVVKERTRELQDSYEALKQNHRQTLFGLAEAIEAKDPYTNGHCGRVAGYTLLLASEVGLDASEMESLEYGSFLHDIGKIGVRDAVLRKPGPLDDEEWNHMRDHPVIGFEIARKIDVLKPILPAVRSHHERWDGTGYPDQLAGEDIPLTARMVAIADAFDAMATDRPYKTALPLDTCEALLKKNAGTMYDPGLVEIFLANHLGAPFAFDSPTKEVITPEELALLEALQRG